MSATAHDKPVVGVIGGSGLYNLSGMTLIKQIEVDTPWGKPSSPISLFSLPEGGSPIAFLTRHGVHHSIAPSSVPTRANLSALKSIGVQCILAFSAVGSLRAELAPGCVVIPDQIIDRTKGVRPASFFEDTGVVAHAAFGEPFSVNFRHWLESRVKGICMERNAPFKMHGTIICMEGPQFSTRAESQMYRAWGADLINMSVLPEAKLAREAELTYALICTVTDYDSWRPAEEAGHVTAHDVFQVLAENADNSRAVASAVLHELSQELGVVGEEKGTMQFSIMPRKAPPPDEGAKKLAFVLPEYFGESAK